jgi:chromosome segregation ATPase
LKTTGEQTPKQKESIEQLDKLLRAVLDEMEKAINRMKENEAIKQLKARIEMYLQQSQPKQKIINDLKAQLGSAQQLLDDAKKMYDDQNKVCDDLQAKLKKLTEEYHIDAAAAQKIVEYFDKLYNNKTTNAHNQKDVDHMRKLMVDFKERISKSITRRCEKEQEECNKKTKEFQDKIAEFTKKEKEMADKLAALEAKLPEAQKAFRDAEMQFTLHQGLYDAKCQECDRILNDNPWYAILSQYLKDMGEIKELLAKVVEAKCVKQAELNNLNKLIEDIMARTQKQLNDKVLEGNVALQRCLAEKAKLYEVFTNWGKVKGKTESEFKQLESEIVGMKNTLELVRIDKKSLIDILEAHIQKCKDDIKQCLGDNLWKIEAVNILKQLLTFLP